MEYKHFFKKRRKSIWLLMFGLFASIALILLQIDFYLFSIQRKERFQDISDFSSFHLSYYAQKRCQKKKRFQVGTDTYFYDCLENVYITYGSTKFTLEEIMKSEKLNLDGLLFYTIKWNTDVENIKEYVFHATKNDIGYKITVEELETGRNITISAY